MIQVKQELATVSKVDQSSQSFARSNYEVSCEIAVNDQVGVTRLANVSSICRILLDAFFTVDQNSALNGLTLIHPSLHLC